MQDITACVQQRAHLVLNSESQSIRSIPPETITESLPAVCTLLLGCTGKVIITGMGKNGHVGNRIAATFSSTGTPSVFLHPGEAAHGDLGILCAHDVVMALSNSGQTREVVETITRVRQYFPTVPLVVVTGERWSPLAKLAQHVLWYGAVPEPCPLGLTPSASLAAMSALLDALALCVMEARRFTRAEFKRFHHRGYLGDLLAEAEEEEGDVCR